MRFSHVRFRAEPHRVHEDFTVSAGGFCCFLHDLEGVRRPGSADDVLRSINMVNHLGEISMTGLPIVDQSLPAPLRPVRMAATLAKYTHKIGGIETFTKQDVRWMHELATIVAGSVDEFRRNPPPGRLCRDAQPLVLRREHDRSLPGIREARRAADGGHHARRRHQAPMSTAGVLAMGVAETIGAMALGFAAREDAVIGIDVTPSFADMQTGLFKYGGGDRCSLLMARVQLLSEFYGVPCGVHGGKTHSCFYDEAAGADKMATFLLPILAGAVGVGTVGHVENAVTFSPVQLVIDNELARYARRAIRQPIEVSDETIPLDLIDAVGPGGSFLGEMHTAERFRDELFLSPLFAAQPWGQGGRGPRADRDDGRRRRAGPPALEAARGAGAGRRPRQGDRRPRQAVGSPVARRTRPAACLRQVPNPRRRPGCVASRAPRAVFAAQAAAGNTVAAPRRRSIIPGGIESRRGYMRTDGLPGRARERQGPAGNRVSNTSEDRMARAPGGKDRTMAEEQHELRRVNWTEVFAFTHIFKSFKMAIYYNQMALAMAAIVLLFCTGWVMDCIWGWAGQYVKNGEIGAYSTQKPWDFQRGKQAWLDARKDKAAALVVDADLYKHNLGDYKGKLQSMGLRDARLRDALTARVDAANKDIQYKSLTVEGVAKGKSYAELLSQAEDLFGDEVGRIDKFLDQAQESAEDAVGKLDSADRDQAEEDLQADVQTAHQAVTALKVEFRQKVLDIRGQKVFSALADYELGCLGNALASVRQGNIFAGLARIGT